MAWWRVNSEGDDPTGDRTGEHLAGYGGRRAAGRSGGRAGRSDDAESRDAESRDAESRAVPDDGRTAAWSDGSDGADGRQWPTVRALNAPVADKMAVWSSAGEPGEPGELGTPEPVAIPRQRTASLPLADATPAVTVARLAGSLTREGIKYLTDEDDSLLALWESYAVLLTVEATGDDQPVLVVRVRAHATTPAEWSSRAYAAVNEWNLSRRTLKAYVGDPTPKRTLALYGEVQIPVGPGMHDALLDEIVRRTTSAAAAYVGWLHDEGVI